MTKIDLRGPVCVLGMGRSGTSLATRVLGLLGVDLGRDETMLGPMPDDNAKGYWEQSAIRDLNDELLATLGGTWSQPPHMPFGWESADELAPLRAQARRIVEEHFPRDGCWAWKDPRTCFTLPFWRKVVEPVAYVMCVRNPIEVAASLHHRDPISHPTNHSFELWLQYNCAALHNTAGERRILLFYDDWFDAPRHQAERLSRFLGAGLPTRATMSRIDAFLKRDLWHHRADPWALVESEDVPMEVRGCYLHLRQIAFGHLEVVANKRSAADLLATERFAEGLWDRLVERREMVRGIAADADAHERRVAAVEQQLARARAEIDSHRRSLTSVQQSSSWRTTAPLRSAKRWICHARAGRDRR